MPGIMSEGSGAGSVPRCAGQPPTRSRRRDVWLAAAVALFDMTAQRCRAAGFDGAHDPALAPTQMAGMGLTVSGTVAAEDIRHLQRAAHPTPLRRAALPRDSGNRGGWVCRR